MSLLLRGNSILSHQLKTPYTSQQGQQGQHPQRAWRPSLHGVCHRPAAAERSHLPAATHHKHPIPDSLAVTESAAVDTPTPDSALCSSSSSLGLLVPAPLSTAPAIASASGPPPPSPAPPTQLQPVAQPPAVITSAAAKLFHAPAAAAASSSLAGQWSVASADSGATVTLLHRVPPAAPPPGPQPFWAEFLDKCRRAWDILRPDTPPPVLAPAAVVRNRLQMILVADRCGMLPADLLVLKERTLASLADQLDAEGFSDMEMCVSATKPNGERLTISMPLSTMPGSLNATRTRDEQLYDYEAGRYSYGSSDDGGERDEGGGEGSDGEEYECYAAAHESDGRAVEDMGLRR